ncbi:MAG: transcription elongation factor GreA [Suipraeoptans sp.]
MGEKLTKEDVRKIKEEIEYRKIVVRKKELEAVKEARAQGDLSENFEYKAAKQDKNRNESRIRYLEKMLKFAQVISDKSAEDEIGVNDIIEVYFPKDNEIEVYHLVTGVRGNSLEGKVSIDSPLGKALLSKKVGEEVTVKTDAFEYTIKIKNIKKNSDESADVIRKY